MSGYRRVNYYELCRLCTSNKGTKVHMFKEEGKRRQIAPKIQICLHLQVSEQDSLPKLICNLCLDKLEGYFKFRSRSIKAEAMLESYARNLSLNNDFVMDGKVYIKENRLEGLEEDTSSEDFLISNATALEDSLQLKSTEIRVSNQANELVSLPVSLDNLGRLIQAATIHFLPEKELSNLQSNLKGAVQVQQNIESGEQSYSYNVQGDIIGEETAVQKSVQNEKSDTVIQSTEDGEDESLDKCSFEKANNRNSVNQIGEFLKLESVTSTEEGSCENCGLRFSSPLERTTHTETCKVGEDPIRIREPMVVVNVEEGERLINSWSFTCSECGRIFKRKENLVQHQRLHTGERPFRCSYCPSTFSRKEHLVRHVLCHTGEKHFSCGICGKLFGRKDNVGKHLRTHQIKPLIIRNSSRVKATFRKEKISSFSYKCDFCGIHFSTQEILKEHMLTHPESDKYNVMVVRSEHSENILKQKLK